mmetsp:Transcript_4177/g.5236  ORF Transcript_4177/g.5236 Transcript_4177/m.5236 type:complete len:424 (+) Transcript_4177:3-1274(+)
MGHDNFPSIISNFFYVVVLNFVVFLQILRLFVYYRRIQINRKLASDQFYLLLQKNPLLKKTAGLLLQEESSTSKELIRRTSDRENDDDHNGLIRARSILKQIEWNRLLASVQVMWLLFFTHFVTFLLATFIIEAQITLRCRGCDFFTQKVGYFGVYLVACFVLVMWALYRLKKEPDPLGTKRELYLGLFPASALAFVGFVLHFFDPWELYKRGVCFWGHIFEAAVLWVYIVLIPLQIKLSYENSPGLFDEQRLTEFLQSDSFDVELFKIHLIYELSIENYYFWKEVTEFRRMYVHHHTSARENDDSSLGKDKKAYYIFNTFFTRNSPLELNLSSDTSRRVERVFEDEFNIEEFFTPIEHSNLNTSNNIPDDVFDESLNDVIKMMAHGSYQRFLRGLSDRRRSLSDDVENSMQPPSDISYDTSR